MKIKDTQSNITYNFQHKSDNVYHEILLPSYVDAKFKDPAILMNEVEPHIIVSFVIKQHFHHRYINTLTILKLFFYFNTFAP